MTDIFIKDNRLPIYNGDFRLVNNLEEVKQHIIVALNTFYSDWVLNTAKGIDYVSGMRNQEFLEHDVKAQIEGVRNVISVDNLSAFFDKSDYTMKISAIVKTAYGKTEVLINRVYV